MIGHLKKYMSIFAALCLMLSGCSETGQHASRQGQPAKQENQASDDSLGDRAGGGQDRASAKSVSGTQQKVIHVVRDPNSTLVLVNKYFKLPDHYTPEKLVYPNVPFTTSQKSEKWKMRPAAAKALERMFAAAEKDGIRLAGVSAYRSHERQMELFNYYVQKYGEKKAAAYSARPGTSEHETGLAIDVSGIDGMYQAAQAFSETPEAKWLKRHAPDYGFIIRYPKGKERVTGYEYESWHLRYVGHPVSKVIAEKGLALEEYLSAVPVSR
ncbi:D-alanyl-D-alanine carboxypeptidase family protein [Sporolactobacillus sp. THM7-7]|nr:D-alanyl-D-alanine carboxypeptidase family protein [Sporolactobacillus sp. THM7-7]